MNKILFAILTIVLLSIFIPSYALADWDPGDGDNMHYPQLPDPDGWDVNFTDDIDGTKNWVADDWQCSEDSSVSDIHFWFSYQDDILGNGEQISNHPIDSVSVKIYTNDAIGNGGIIGEEPDNYYSKPLAEVWSGEFPLNQLIIRHAGNGDQGWYDPKTSNWNRPDHTHYYQCNIQNIAAPFVQQAGEIYWLALSATPDRNVYNTEVRIGWKTSQDHFMDDGVFMSPSGNWHELYDPKIYNDDVVTEDFNIMLLLDIPPVPQPPGSGSGYQGNASSPWFYYENEGWYNQWFLDGEYNVQNDKVVHIEFSVDHTNSANSFELALNWTTDQWTDSTQPPLPPLSPEDEDRFIKRQVLVPAHTIQNKEYYSLDYVIKDYNPTWVSVDVRGYNFNIQDGTIEHACVPSLDMAFVLLPEVTTIIMFCLGLLGLAGIILFKRRRSSRLSISS